MKVHTNSLMLLLCPAVAAAAAAFAPLSFSPSSAFVREAGRRRTLASEPLFMNGASGNNMDNFDLSGNAWKPTEGRMQSTDTGDYLPEGYVEDLDFTEGMVGSQAGLSDAFRADKGPELPGMENLGEDALMMGGIELAEGIPADMEFVPSSVPDGNFDMSVSMTSSGDSFQLEVKPYCMGYEDYYAAFTADSHPCLKLNPNTAVGRMDRRGGESTWLDVTCDPRGHSPGTYEGNLVVNVPDDGSKLTYKFTATIV